MEAVIAVAAAGAYRAQIGLTLANAMGDGIAYELLRVRNREGGETTVSVVRHPAASTRVTVVCFGEPTRLDQWCAAAGRPEAIVAGFFLRDPYRPLGEVRIAGDVLPHEPVVAPWASARACVYVDGSVRLARRHEVGVDSGLELGELARLMVSFGAREAINLDGGGSATLLHRGHLLNRPYSADDQPAPESRPVVTALLFEAA